MNFSHSGRDKRLQPMFLPMCCLSCLAAALQQIDFKINCQQLDYSSGKEKRKGAFPKGKFCDGQPAAGKVLSCQPSAPVAEHRFLYF